MERKKSKDLTAEEVKETLSHKRWKKTNDYKELEERIQKGLDSVKLKKADLNAIKTFFYKYPEVFVFDKFVQQIRDDYNSNISGMSRYGHNPYNRQDNMEETLKTFHKVAKEIYGDLIERHNLDVGKKIEAEKEEKKRQLAEAEKKELEKDDYIDFATIFDDEVEEKGEKKMEEKTKKSKLRRITPKIRALFSNDETLLKNLLKNVAGEEKTKFLKYLWERKVETVGEYMKLLEDEKRSYAFWRFSYDYCGEVYTVFKQAILDYIRTSMQKARVQTDGPQDNQCLSKTDSKEPETEKVEDFYENLKKMPAKNFVKGSEEMNKIGASYGEYLSKILKKHLEQNVAEMDVDALIEEENKLIDEENKKYQPIVDAKRAEEYEAKAKRVAGFATAKIAESVKYKHSKAKTQDEIERKHQHNPYARDEREL